MKVDCPETTRIFQAKQVHVGWIAAEVDDDKLFLPYLKPRTRCQGLSAVEMKHSDYPSDFGNWRPGNPDDIISSISFGRYLFKDIVFPQSIDFMGEYWWLEPQYHRQLGQLTIDLFPLRYTSGRDRVIYGRPQLSRTWCNSFRITFHWRLILMSLVKNNSYLSISTNGTASRSFFWIEKSRWRTLCVVFETLKKSRKQDTLTICILRSASWVQAKNDDGIRSKEEKSIYLKISNPESIRGIIVVKWQIPVFNRTILLNNYRLVTGKSERRVAIISLSSNSKGKWSYGNSVAVIATSLGKEKPSCDQVCSMVSRAHQFYSMSPRGTSNPRNRDAHRIFHQRQTLHVLMQLLKMAQSINE